MSSKLVAVARTQRFQLAPRAGFASAGGLKREEVEARVLDVFKDFDKVNVEKVCAWSFANSRRVEMLTACALKCTADTISKFY